MLRDDGPTVGEQMLRTSDNAFLLGLSDRLRRIDDPAEILLAAAAALGERLGMSRAGFAKVDGDRGLLTVERDWTDGRVAPGTGTHRIADFGPAVTDMLLGGETQRIADATTDTRIGEVDRKAFDAMEIVSAVTVPLVRDNRLVAAFSTHGVTPRAWSDAEVRLVEQVAERSWAAHELAQTAAQLQASEARLAFLLHLSDETRSKADATAILEATAALLANHLGLKRVTYGEVDEARDLCFVKHAWGYGLPGGERSHPVSLFSDEMRENLRAGITFVTEDASEDLVIGAPAQTLARSIGTKGMITVPLVREGTIKAYLSVHDTERRRWSDSEVRLVREVAERTWATLVRAQAEEELRRSESRRTFLLTLADGTRPLADPDMIMAVTTDLLSAELGVSSASYSSIDLVNETVRTAHFHRQAGSLDISVYPVAVLAGELLAAHLKGEVFRSSEIGCDDRISDGTKDICRSRDVASIMSAPLVKEGELVGLLSISHDRPRAWTDDEADLLAEVAERTWANIDRAATAVRLKERDASSAFLLDLGDRLREQASASDMLHVAVEAIGRRLEADRVGYAEIDSDANLLAVNVEWGNGNLQQIGGTYPLAAFGRYHVAALSRGEIARIEDTFDSPHIAEDNQETVHGIGVRAAITVPLVRDGKLVALLSAHHGQPRNWTDAEVRLVEEVAERTWAIVERARAEADLARSQEALYQSEKLTALGSLLAGLSHEMNNPLSVVVLQSVMMEEDATGTPYAGRARRIREAAERCSKIVATFLAMARQRPPQRAAISINDSIEAALGLAAYGLRSSGITIDRRLGCGLPLIEADPDQLHQVFVNLIINAQHALQSVEGERRLSLVTRSAQSPGMIEVEVGDNGPGVSSEVRRRIFEPFFTTKPQGAGTGLGLSFSLGVIEAHGGRLELLDGGGDGDGGATFRVTLPAKADGGADTVTDVGEGVTARRNLRSALVIDDEPEIADTLAELLERDGYDVMIARSGTEARARLAERDFDLLLSDLRMPDGDGPSLYAWIKAERPHLARRIGFVTGDTIEPGAMAFLGKAGRPTLEKPFTPAALRAFVGKVAESLQ